MRRLWAAGAAVMVCLASTSVPALAQEEATAVTGTESCSVVDAGTPSTVDGVMQVTDMVIACTDTMNRGPGGLLLARNLLPR